MKSTAKANPTNTLDPSAQEFVPGVSRSTSDENVKNSYEQICVICSEKRSHFAVGSCNHPVCSICSLRMRHKSHNQDCSICKRVLPYVIVYAIKNGPKLFESFDLDDVDQPRPGFEIDHATNTAFYKCKEYYRKMMNLRSFSCPIKSCSHIPNDNVSLLKHFERDHGSLRLCQLCLEHRPIFIEGKQGNLLMPTINQ
jgi:hypothetical protein